MTEQKQHSSHVEDFKKHIWKDPDLKQIVRTSDEKWKTAIHIWGLKQMGATCAGIRKII